MSLEEHTLPDISPSLTWVLSWNKLLRVWGGGLLAAETTNASGLSANKQAPFNVLWHMAWEARSSMSVSDRSQRQPTAHRHPAAILGTLPKGSFPFWSIVNPLLLSACLSLPSFPPFLSVLHSACSQREIGQT